MSIGVSVVGKEGRSECGKGREGERYIKEHNG